MAEDQQEDYGVHQTNTFKDYIRLIRANWVPVVLITLVGLIVASIYAINAIDIYKSTATIKISRPQGGSVLTSPLLPEFQEWGNDRFIANEIEIMTSYTARRMVAVTLIDSFYRDLNKSHYFVLKDTKLTENESDNNVKSVDDLAIALSDVSIDQKRGLDIIELSAVSPSPYEAALIANVYAQQYKKLNLEQNRDQLTLVTNFLDEQRKEKYDELNAAEETLRDFQESGGLIALDERASTLISVLAQFEAQKSATQVDLMASNKVLENLRKELQAQNPRMADYLTSLTSQKYITAIQEEITKLEINKQVALSKKDGLTEDSPVILEYDRKINELRKELDKELGVLKAGIFASSPEEVKELTQKIIAEEVKNQSLQTSIKELDKIVEGYEARFMKLPKNTIELARLKRNSEALEKLYLMIEQRYQEALINEQSQPGNVLIIDEARVAQFPSKPNRKLIIIIGFLLGAGLAVGYVFVKNYFDDTVKSPDDIEHRNINVLAWIPHFDSSIAGDQTVQFIVDKLPDSIPSEAFRALRTRIQFSRINTESLKTILITSSAPQEGKTTIAVNLAGSFAHSKKKVLLIDCDLRKPSVHKLFEKEKVPGLIDYLVGSVKLEEVLMKSKIQNLSFISSGTIPPNPAEMLDSQEMRNFLKQLREKFDLIILDSPPIIAVTDSEILTSMVDGTLLVVSSESTEIDMMERSVELIRRENTQFLGTVLNNFSYKSGYGSYYKYYYYYSRPETKS
ncbi:MAG: polysaccharide biosynthesis tyrosine autokinase [Ignavibacteriota bacterium]|nr:polysaccharide biosynthesis tyrosine autokinase [Ignavibacteriales bacterium]MBL1124455.1 polysaccharide biosynthesis tyrosine autokinase [Ignavibacteriota bacterium]MBV6419248.1 Iron-sulfur cluster carrier protein [Ignavibacteriaceae bacterium]QKJ97580.1 MAG: polysaccharide biosynthesis tyrosine autokinase [Ignavibacteriota bacterium]GIK62086.1 MAG: tyrosine-protein kinase etk [Ignavibacteriota bacterium]